MITLNIKKILLFSLLVILIPFIVVNIFIKEDEIKFNHTSNMVVRVYRAKEKKIIYIPLEQYIYGVVSSEMPIGFEKEALKAQAVASRTYVLYNIESHKDKDYDVYDTEDSQVYQTDEELKEKWKDKYVEYSNKIKRIIMETKGEYLSYDGKIIEAFFFSTSSGYTENSEDVFSEKLPYLRSVESKWDKDSPSYDDKKEYSKIDFYNKLGLEYSDKLNISSVKNSKTGRIISLKINGIDFKSSDVREKLKLRSTFFNIESDNKTVTIKTKGYGHGVGMSQYGANGMALAGFLYKDILKYYYTGVKIEKIKK